MALLNANLVSPERITNELLILNPSPTEALLLMNLLRNICKEKLLIAMAPPPNPE